MLVLRQRSRYDAERPAPPDSIYREIPIHCEDEVRVQFFGENNQRRVSKIHRQVGVFSHEGSTALKRNICGGGDEDPAPKDEIETGDRAVVDISAGSYGMPARWMARLNSSQASGAPAHATPYSERGFAT